MDCTMKSKLHQLWSRLKQKIRWWRKEMWPELRWKYKYFVNQIIGNLFLFRVFDWIDLIRYFCRMSIWSVFINIGDVNVCLIRSIITSPWLKKNTVFFVCFYRSKYFIHLMGENSKITKKNCMSRNLWIAKFHIFLETTYAFTLVQFDIIFEHSLLGEHPAINKTVNARGSLA